mmetsp:Transcript_9723/g.15925  ORF Transcript_9723/g.15925 Transcript_9723/m.15925 type:complete len:393 (-) Transcript_9723:378-1556(-)
MYNNTSTLQQQHSTITMGRVARYKKVKSIDPFAKNNTWTSDQGDKSTLRRAKRKSKTALRLQQQKLRQRKGKKGAGSNGWGHDEGYDLPPEGGDEFDMADLMGSVKKQVVKNSKKIIDPLMEPQVLASSMPSVTPSSSSLHQVKQTKKINGDDNKKAAAEKLKKKGGKKQPQKHAAIATPDGDLVITHKTPTREIIEAHSNPKRKQAAANNNSNTAVTDEDTGPTKQERRKAYLQEKKLKKKKGGASNNNDTNTNDSDDEMDVLANHRLQQQQQYNSTAAIANTTNSSKQPKKHITQQQNYSDTIVARSVIDDQVERPPTFSVLPRGAHKLSKNQKKKNKNNNMGNNGSSSFGDDVDKEQRIRKEQQALEAMREKVMRQYSIMREKRRSGGV